jgi:tetratricopeptide (TPR) repeat protein
MLYAALIAIAIRGLLKKNVYAFCVLFYFLSYSFTCNFFFKIGSSFAERLLFVPSLAFCIALPFLLAQIFKIDFKQNTFQHMPKYIALLSIVLILFSFKTINRNKDWRDSVTLFESGISTSPNSARVHFAYANDFREKTESATDMYQKIEFGKSAIEAFQKGLAIYDKDERIFYNMGVVYYNMNDTTNAFSCYQKALQMNANYPEALNNLGVIYFNKKDLLKARELFEKSVKNNKNYADAYANLGACLHNSGEVKSAIPNYLRSIEINPDNISVKRNLSMAYKAIGDSASAAFYRNQAY